MSLADLLPDFDDVPASLMDESIWESFLGWCKDEGISLYPHQEEAAFAALAGDHVIVATPTGSGKSLIAIAAHFIAMAKGQRSFYTAPIKALVSEKFFALCEVFGADNVGMMTGDATVNAKAPIICATAEVVANIALREGADSRIDQVIMDEFHYYSDPARGWAWQVPLLELTRAQFILMSATLGDTAWLVEDLHQRTGRDTQLIEGAQRPVPLTFDYVYTHVPETVEQLLADGQAPVYVVHFTQREATERAQSLSKLSPLTKEEQQRLRQEIGDFRFTTSFGKQLSSLLRKGIGVHHAGMLPKYRRLVERLSQTGLLKIICGTDTLGVGINVPIRTVLMTGLAKFDGTKQRIMKSREFHQIAGRAGRAGFDTHGYVVIQAPEHEIENFRLRQRAGSDPKKLKKLRKKAAPAGTVTWSENTYKKLIEAEPEPLVSQFAVSTSMLLNVLARGGDHFAHFQHLLRGSHNPRSRQNSDIRTAIELFRGLAAAEIVQRVEQADGSSRWDLVAALQEDFALNQPLAPFALAALDLLDKDSDTYAYDVISVFEAVLDDPRAVLLAQQRAARDREHAALLAEGVDYSERMALLDEITWPQPLAELLDQAYDTYAVGHPWVKDFQLSPKSIVRHMVERGMTFSDLISTYGLARSEGVVLRYLTDAWRTLQHSVPEEYRNEELADILIWLGELIRQVDSSLLDEWALLADPDAPVESETLAEVAFGVADPTVLSANRRALTIMVRNFAFRLVQLFADEQEETLHTMLDYLAPEDCCEFGAAMDEYFDEFDDVLLDQDARSATYFSIDDSAPREWVVRQIIKDPEDSRAYAFTAVVDLDATDAAGEVRLSKLLWSAH
ncbi:DEAD/DEAH box helicase [Corynebacterium choanae]|uniref:Ski2-like helicase n=1 Tax=Corynebacterium choanae TaxID=1862358 RepID=A0A3G6J795_9CORY|nr:DEAD/DEAH box helicase [Corynebacterium choanae]AZA13749.1 ski2-like helicase [Corynebacterium choanae]